MLMPSIFGENIIDDYFGDFPFYYEKEMKKKTLFRVVVDKILLDRVLRDYIQCINSYKSVTLWLDCTLNLSFSLWGEKKYYREI